MTFSSIRWQMMFISLDSYNENAATVRQTTREKKIENKQTKQHSWIGEWEAYGQEHYQMNMGGFAR